MSEMLADRSQVITTPHRCPKCGAQMLIAAPRVSPKCFGHHGGGCRGKDAQK